MSVTKETTPNSVFILFLENPSKFKESGAEWRKIAISEKKRFSALAKAEMAKPAPDPKTLTIEAKRKIMASIRQELIGKVLKMVEVLMAAKFKSLGWSGSFIEKANQLQIKGVFKMGSF